jgi:hypothetical protein
VSLHPSSTALPPQQQQQQQQPLSYYGIPQVPPQQQQQSPPVAPPGAIDNIDPSQKVGFTIISHHRDVSLTRLVKGNASPSPSSDARTN